MGSQALAVSAAILVENARPSAMVIARIKRRNDMGGSSRPHRRICRWARRCDYRGLTVGSKDAVVPKSISAQRDIGYSAGEATGAGSARDPPPATALSAT